MRLRLPGGVAPRIKGLALAVALLGTWAVVGAPTPPTRPTTTWRLPAWSAFERIELRRTGAADVVLSRTPAGWQVEGSPLDASALRDLAEVFEAPMGADPADTVAEEALAPYGLTADALTATVVAEGQTSVFRVGKVVDGRRTFVLPQPGTQVLRAHGHLRRALDRPPEAWRDRRLFPEVGYADVQRGALFRGDRLDWAVTRTAPQDPWQLEGGGLLDQDVVGGSLNTFATLSAGAFPPADSPFQAVARFEGRTFAGRTLVLELSATQPGGGLRARRLPDGLLVDLPAHLVGFLDVSSGALADRRLFPGGAGAQAIALGGANPLRLERTAAGWTLVAPEVRPLPPAAAERIQALLEARAAGLIERVPPGAFDRPFHTVQVRLADNQQLALTIGAEYQGGARFARTGAGEAQTLVLSAATVRALTPTLEALLAP